MAVGKVPKLVFVVPKKAFKDFKAQPVIFGVGGDGVSPVKSGPQLKVESSVAQFALEIDFVSEA